MVGRSHTTIFLPRPPTMHPGVCMFLGSCVHACVLMCVCRCPSPLLLPHLPPPQIRSHPACSGLCPVSTISADFQEVPIGTV